MFRPLSLFVGARYTRAKRRNHYISFISLTSMIGLGLGVLGGVSLALNISTIVPWIEKLFSTHFLAKDVYYISELPSQLLWSDVSGIVGVAFVLTLVATLYPSWRASRINPAEALRYE